MKEILPAKLNLNEFKILDVRTPGEFEQGHIENALNIDIYQRDFKQKVGELDKKEKWLVYCRTDNRSRAAAQVMEALGFDVTILVGGYSDY